MACNVNNRGRSSFSEGKIRIYQTDILLVVPKTVAVKGGDNVTFEWYHNTCVIKPSYSSSPTSSTCIYIGAAMISLLPPIKVQVSVYVVELMAIQLIYLK